MISYKKPDINLSFTCPNCSKGLSRLKWNEKVSLIFIDFQCGSQWNFFKGSLNQYRNCPMAYQTKSHLNIPGLPTFQELKDKLILEKGMEISYQHDFI